LLQCIICRLEQIGAFDLCQQSTLQKCLVKYGKVNGIIPMKTHVESRYPKLVAHKKLAIVEQLLMQVIVKSPRRSGLCYLGVQS
jgi:hypothetical protein